MSQKKHLRRARASRSQPKTKKINHEEEAQQQDEISLIEDDDSVENLEHHDLFQVEPETVHRDTVELGLVWTDSAEDDDKPKANRHEIIDSTSNVQCSYRADTKVSQ
jgi:hypothetical protein